MLQNKGLFWDRRPDLFLVNGACSCGDILGCAEKGGCCVPRHKPSVTYPLKRQPVTYPLSRSLHVFRRTKLFGYVPKTSLCYIPHVTGYVTGVGQGPCYKPIVLARAHIQHVRPLKGGLDLQRPGYQASLGCC